jgi:hypothetical protein
MLLPRNTLRLRSACRRRGLSSRASAVLSSLDISTSTELSGVYDGTWKGTGDILESICPTTGEVIARVKSVSSSAAVALGYYWDKNMMTTNRQHLRNFIQRWRDLERHMSTSDTYQLLKGETF